jgi:hypothetical protein
MNKMKFLGLTLSLINLFACAQTTNQNSQNPNQNGWKMLDQKEYSIQYPGDWELSTSGQMGTTFMILSARSSDQDQFRENVNLLIQDLSGQNINLDKYVEISEGQIKTMITDGNIIESKRLNLNGLTFHKEIYTGRQGIYNLKIEQYYCVERQKAYILTLTCEVKEFEKFKDTGERILNSFKLKLH